MYGIKLFSAAHAGQSGLEEHISGALCAHLPYAEQLCKVAVHFAPKGAGGSALREKECSPVSCSCLPESPDGQPGARVP